MVAVCGLGVLSLILVAREITASIERRAHCDPLTGAFNRLGIEELLAIELSVRAALAFHSLALLDETTSKPSTIPEATPPATTSCVTLSLLRSSNRESGEVVDHSIILPAGVAEEVKVHFPDGTNSVAIRSTALGKFYVTEWKESQGCDVEDVISPGGKTEFLLYPDAGGLVLVPTELPQVSIPCADAATLNATDLALLGLSKNGARSLLDLLPRLENLDGGLLL